MGVNPGRRWLAALGAVMALAVGIFLVVFPWLSDWSLNYLQDLNPVLESRWDDPLFRSGISCLGILNLLISFREARRVIARSR